MWKSVGIFFLSILINLTVIPVLSLILTPFVIFRFVVKHCAKWYAPNLKSILSPGVVSSIAGEGFCAEQKKTGIIAVTLNGRVDVDQVCNSFQDKVLYRRNLEGQFRHPELQQFVTKWFGHYFWQDEPQFDISAHVQLWTSENPDSVVTQEDFKTIVNVILKTEFTHEQSPWRLYVIHNTRISTDPPGIGNKTTLVFHFHHVLGGGVDVMSERVLQPWFENNLTNESPGSEMESAELKPSSHCHKSVNWRLILKILKFMTFGTYDFLKTLMDQSEAVDWGAANVKTQVKCEGDLKIHTSESVSTAHINDIRSIFGTNVISIVLVAYAGALRRFMIQHLIKLPSSVTCTVQMERRSNIESSEFGCSSDLQLLVRLPIDELDSTSAKERIRLIQKNLSRASHSTEPLTRLLFHNALGFLPSNFGRQNLQNLVSKYLCSGTSLLTVLNATDKKILCNSEVVGIFPLEKCSVPGLLGPSLLCNVYGNSAQFILCMDSSVMPSTLPLKDLNTFIFKELNDLFKLDAASYV